MKKNIIPDTVELIEKIQQRLISLERKIDTLISNSSPRPVEVKSFPKQENSYRERAMYKAVCADCRKECEVPFKPSGERPVYCKECFSKRKANSPFKGRPDNRPKETVSAHVIHANKPQAAEKKKPAVKKKPAAKKRKGR